MHEVKKILAICMALFVVACLQGKVFTGEKRNDPFTIHGRLSCYNGSANLRIWIVGSKRMLYVAGDDTPALDRVNKYLGDGGGWFCREIFGDFTVEPLESDIKGHMRPVRILAIKHVVITNDGKVIAKKPEL